MIHIVLLGDTYVGKSTLFNRLTATGQYNEGFCSTIIPTYGVYKNKYIFIMIMRFIYFHHIEEINICDLYQ